MQIRLQTLKQIKSLPEILSVSVRSDRALSLILKSDIWAVELARNHQCLNVKSRSLCFNKRVRILIDRS